MATWVALTQAAVLIGGPGKASWGKNVVGDLNYLKENTDLANYLTSMFDSFAGDGSDGSRTDAASAGLAIGTGKQYTDWTIDAGQTMTLTGDTFKVCRIGVSGTLTINGHITTLAGGHAGGAGGTGGAAGTAVTFSEQVGLGSPFGGGGGGGYGSGGNAGAAGGTSTLLAANSAGGAGGASGGGNGSAGLVGGSAVAALLAQSFKQMFGGTGGGGGGSGYDNGGPAWKAGGAGGAGGAMLVIECGTLVFDAAASIVTSGVAGTAGTAGVNGGGGGGAGGAAAPVVILARTITDNSGTVTVTGGAAGAGGGGGSGTGGAGGAGGAGASLIATVG